MKEVCSVHRAVRTTAFLLLGLLGSPLHHQQDLGLVRADIIKIGLMGTYTNDSSSYRGNTPSTDYELHYGIAAALEQGVLEGRLPPGDSFQLLVRNIPDVVGAARAQATDLIETEEVLAIAGVYLNGVDDAFAVGGSTSPVTPMIGGIVADPTAFFGENALHAINYRVTFAEEAIEMVNLAVNSKMRCKKFAVVYHFAPTVAAVGEGLLEILADRSYTNITNTSYGLAGLSDTEEAQIVADYVMGGAGNGVPTCILNIGAARFTRRLAEAIADHANYTKGETFLISTSVSNLPDRAYSDSIRGLTYTIQQLPHPDDTTWLFVRRYQAAIAAMHEKGGFQHNVTTLPNSTETVDIYVSNRQAPSSYMSIEGYMVGRMLLEIFTKMPKPYTRQGIMDVVYPAGFFKVDDLNVGPFASGCVGKRTSTTSSSACVCNQGNKILYTSHLNESGVTVQYEADSTYSEEASVTTHEMSLSECAFKADSIKKPRIFLVPVDTNYSAHLYNHTGHGVQGSFEDYLAESLKYHEMLVYTLGLIDGLSRDDTAAMVPLLQVKGDMSASMPELLERYTLTAIVGGAHNVSSPDPNLARLDPSTHGVYDLEDPHVTDFQRNHIRTEPVLADYITTNVEHFYHEIATSRDAKPYTILVLAETEAEAEIVRKALWTQQVSEFSELVISTAIAAEGDEAPTKPPSLDAWLEATYGASALTEDQPTAVIFMASQYGISVNATVAFAAAHSTTVELHLATGEEFIEAAVDSLADDVKAAWTTNNMFFASFIEAYWAPDYSNSRNFVTNFYYFLGQSRQASWARLRGFRMAIFVFTSQEAIYTTVTDLVFLNVWYSQGSISAFSETLGRFFDDTCSLEVNETNNVDRTCQCNKGPRSFYTHSARDWALNVQFANLSTDYVYTLSTCGVRYEPLVVVVSRLVAFLIFLGLLVAFIAAVVGALVVCLTPKKRDLSAAPKDQHKPFAMAFTDIQSSTNLWARLPEKMGDAVDTHHEIIRRLIKTHKGYEVKTIGDSFMVAFTKTQKAVEFGVALQYELYNHDWGHRDIDDVYRQLAEEKLADAEEENVMDDSRMMLGSGPTSPESAILSIPGLTDIKSLDTAGNTAMHKHLLDHITDATVWNGLRVRVGIHHGLGEIKFDQVSLGYDYYGTVVNTAARVEGVGNGGQVLVTGSAYDDLTNGTHEVPLLNVSISNMGHQPLRGLDEPVELHLVLPAGLAGRQFAPLRLDVERDIETEDDEMSVLTGGTSIVESGGGSTVVVDALITPEILAERYARRTKGDLRFHATFHQLVANFNITKAVFSTSTEKKKKDVLEHWAQKWRVNLKANKNMTAKAQFDRHLMQLLIKVSPTVEAAKQGTHLTALPNGSQGSRASRRSNMPAGGAGAGGKAYDGQNVHNGGGPIGSFKASRRMLYNNDSSHSSASSSSADLRVSRSHDAAVVTAAHPSFRRQPAAAAPVVLCEEEEESCNNIATTPLGIVMCLSD